MTITRSLEAPKGSPITRIATVLSALQNFDLSHVEAADISLTVSSTNLLQKTGKTSTVTGFAAVVKYLASVSSELNLWSEGCESWVSDDVNDLADKAEEHLAKSERKFLVGDEVTSADLVVAFQLEAAGGKLPPKVHGLVSSVLENSQVLLVGETLNKLELGTEDASSPPVAATGNAIVDKIAEMGVNFDVVKHDAIVTADELVDQVKLPANSVHTKNLLLRDSRNGLFLVTVNAHADIDVSGTKITKLLKSKLSLTGRVNCRMADDEILKSTLATEKGCLGPLCLLNDAKTEVRLVLDEDLFNQETIYSHPASNELSIGIKSADLKSFVEEKLSNKVDIISFASDTADAAAEKVPKQKAEKKKKEDKSNQKKKVEKGQTLLALQWKKNENFAQWYSDVIVLSECISYYDVSGCYILRPWSYSMWESIQDFMNIEIKKLGVDNCYFPLFVSRDRLEKEKDHVEGFAPEVAWVTKSGESDLAQHIAIRPTSETIMYPTFSQLIRSHRDLPLQVNQWSNVVRWEFKDPTPFLRSREFLWQEGHTAHSTAEEADKMVMDALMMYKRTYEDLLAVPVIPGYKTEKEKFAGGKRTTTVEAYIAGSGRAIQGATSHDLGQNFGKMFDITFQNEQGEKEIAHQTSWGFTTRSIGVMIMMHGDDKGLVLPPRVSPQQVVIVPITSKTTTMEMIGPYCEKIEGILRNAGVRVKYDSRDMYNPGWKYNHWEQKGVPIRLECGPKDLEKSMVRVVTRYNGAKDDVAVDENFAAYIADKLEFIQKDMLRIAAEHRDNHVVQITEWKDFVPNLEKNNLVLTPWCGGEHQDWEEWVKNKSKDESLKGAEEDERAATSVAAKTLCIPFNQPKLPPGTKCIASGMDATCWVLWGRSY